MIKNSNLMRQAGDQRTCVPHSLSLNSMRKIQAQFCYRGGGSWEAFYSFPPPHLSPFSEAHEKRSHQAPITASISPRGKAIDDVLAGQATPCARCGPRNRERASPSASWASGLIAHLTPISAACFHHRQSKSRRHGLAFNSITVAVAAQASMTAGISTA